MNKGTKWATRAMAALPLLLVAVASMAFAGVSGSSVQPQSPSQSPKKSVAPLDGSPGFPPHYFDRSTPALTIRHVSARTAGGELHPPPPPGRHSRLHHPHFPPPLSLRRRPAGGETAPPYAVQMEPLVQYSPRDPLYANAVDSEEDNSDKRTVEGGPEEPSQSLDEEKEEAPEDQEGGAATLRSQHAEDKSSSGHPIRNFPVDIGDIRRAHTPQYSYHTVPPVYGQPSHHGPHYGHGPRYVVLKEPEPIIEIIVKESNVSLPAPPEPLLQPKTREPVQVFYVKYEKKKGKSGGDADSVIFDRPILAQPPLSPEPLPPVHIPEELDGKNRASPTVTPPSVYTAPPPVETTTLRALIRPDSEQVHHPHSHTHALRISFGEERTHRKESEAVEEEQSAPQPSFAAPNPNWAGPNGTPLPPFRQLPEQHFRTQQPTRFFPNPHQQQFAPPLELNRQNQFHHQPRLEGHPSDSRAFPPPHRSLPPPGSIPFGPNPFVNGQSFRSNPGFPPLYYSDRQQHQQAHLRQQQLQQFQQQQQQKNLLQLQEQQKQQQHALQFQRLPPPPFHPPNKPGPPAFHVGSQQPLQLNHQQPPSPSTPSFLRLPTHPEIPLHRSPVQVGEIVKAIPKLEQHHIQSPVIQAHSLTIPSQERRPPQGVVDPSHFPRNQPGIGNQHQGVQGATAATHFVHNQSPGVQSTQQPTPQSGRQPFPQQPVQNGSQNPGVPVHLNKNNQQNQPPSSIQHSFPPQRHAHSQQNSVLSSSVHNRFSNLPPTESNPNIHSIHQQQQQYTVTGKPSPTPEPSFGTTVLHYPTPPPSTAHQINSLGSKNVHASTTPQSLPSTAPTTTSTTAKPIPELPDEIPDDLREQLLSSGILSNADIQILDYDKIGDIPIESLPPEALSGLVGSGLQPAASENRPVSVTAPLKGKEKTKEAVEMKVVRYVPGSEEKAVGGLIRDDVEETKVLAPVSTSREDEKDETYRRYLPLRISGERFPVPDVPELRGRNVTSVVVLAPVGFPAHGRERRAEGVDVAEEQAEYLLSSGRLNALLKNPSEKNFREWLDSEKKASPEDQAVVLLVSPKEAEPEDKGDIFMLDVGSGRLSQLRGELSAAFVQVAKENARDSGLSQKRHSNANI